MITNIKNLFILFAVVVFVSAPIGVLAQASGSTRGEVEWGGLHLVTLDESICTCSGNSHWILDYRTNSLLMLYYQAGQSVIFTNYNTRATYQLGSYSMSSQPCSILVGEVCVDLTNMGTYGMFPGTGTSIVKANKESVFKEYKPAAPQISYFSALKNSSMGVFKKLSI